MATRTHPTHEGEGAVLNTTEARQGTRPRAMLWVLLISLALAIAAGIVLGLGWISLPL
jgi:hypothetical protein